MLILQGVLQDDDEEHDSLLGSFKSIQHQIRLNLALSGMSLCLYDICFYLYVGVYIDTLIFAHMDATPDPPQPRFLRYVYMCTYTYVGYTCMRTYSHR